MDEIKQRQLNCYKLAQWLALSANDAISLANHIGGLQDLMDYNEHAETLERALATAMAYLDLAGWNNEAARASFEYHKQQAAYRIELSRGEQNDDLHS